MPRKRIDDQFPKLSAKHFGARVREIRIKRGMSENTLAVKIGVGHNYIPQLERGEKSPSFTTLIYIANALNVTADELLCDYTVADNKTIASNLCDAISQLDKQDQRHVEALINAEIKYMKSR